MGPLHFMAISFGIYIGTFLIVGAIVSTLGWLTVRTELRRMYPPPARLPRAVVREGGR